jgi:hypothetical protein
VQVLLDAQSSMIVLLVFAYHKIVQVLLRQMLSVEAKWVQIGFAILLMACVFNLHAICLLTLTLFVGTHSDQHINVKERAVKK